MTASFARACPRGSRLGLTTPVPSAKRGRTVPVNGGSLRDEIPPIYEMYRAWTGLDHGQGEVSPIRPRAHEAEPAALSSLALSISVRMHGGPASHQRGFKTASKMRLFWGKESHSVPYSSINFYLFEACGTCLESRSVECRRGDLARGRKRFDDGVGYLRSARHPPRRQRRRLRKCAERSQFL